MPARSTCDPPALAPPPSSGGRGDAAALLALAALALLMGALILPVGEFPLNDDWSYARAVQTWLETGTLRFTGWTSVPLVAQALWGALFCLPGGFSFAALRLSTAVAGLLGAWGLFFLLRSAGRNRPTAFAAALTLAVNPLYVNLSHTFMTDVPFVAAALWALAGFVRSFSDPRPRWLWLGLVGSVAATLVRHTGLVLPLAYFLACRLGPRDAVRSRSGWPGAVTALALAGFCACGAAWLDLRPFWMNHGDALASGFRAPARMLERAGEIAIYLGLFGLPFELFALSGESRRRSLLRIAWILPLAALTALGLDSLGIRLPMAGNVLHAAGLGPVRLYDVATLGLSNGASFAAGWWTLATGLGVAGAGLGACRWLAAWRAPASDSARRTRGLLVLCAAGWLAPMLAAGYMDRYLLALLPIWCFGPTPSTSDGASRSRGWLAAALLAALLWATFAVAATHDYFSWNRARWAALNDLTARRRVSPDRIDGGFEFNGWHLYDPAHPADRQPPPDKSWWWVADDEYVVTLGPVPGYAEQSRHPFSSWLGHSPGEIRVGRRDPP